MKLRKRLNEKFPDTTFFFQPANITNQILNFGLPAPIDLQVVGRDAVGGYKIALDLASKIARIPGAVDVHVHQVVDQPDIRMNVDRIKAGQLGLTERDVSGNMLISLSGNGTVAPGLLGELGRTASTTYVGVQTPQYKVNSPGRAAADAGFGRKHRRQLQHRRIAGRVGDGGEHFGGRVSQRRVAGVWKPRSHGGQHAASFESGYRHARRQPGDRQSL